MKSQTLVIITFKMIGHVEWYLINIHTRVTSHLHCLNVIVFIILINVHMASNIEPFIECRLTNSEWWNFSSCVSISLLLPWRALSTQGPCGAPAVPEGPAHVPHPGAGLGIRRTGAGRVEDRGEWRSSGLDPVGPGSLEFESALCSRSPRPAAAPTAGQSAGQRRRLYSAVPGRVFVATRSHSAQGEREISFNKGDRVKGEHVFQVFSWWSVCVCVCVNTILQLSFTLL